jgi:hypothetical protein
MRPTWSSSRPSSFILSALQWQSSNSEDVKGAGCPNLSICSWISARISFLMAMAGVVINSLRRVSLDNWTRSVQRVA